MNASSPRIAIVGGGMVGAVQALLLAHNLPSAEITLYDKTRSSPTNRASFDGRSTALAPTSQQCFEFLGLWPAIEPFATPIDRVHVSDKGHAGMALLDERDNAGMPLGYVVMNSGLGEAVLAAVKACDRIQEVMADVARVVPQASGASVELSGIGLSRPEFAGEQKARTRYDLVIIADGANSTLRAQLGIAFQKTDYDQCALVANVRHEIPHQSTAYERFRAEGPIALLPLGKDSSSHESTLVWTCQTRRAEQLMAATEAERLHALQQDFGFRLGYFQAMSTPASYPLALVVAKEQVRSGIVLMGNAAHFLHPVAGQGFNLSMRDMLRLTGVLKQAVSAGEPVGELRILQRYEALQAADQRTTIGLSHGFNRVFGAKLLPSQLLRTLGLLAIESNTTVRNIFIDLLSGKAYPKAVL